MSSSMVIIRLNLCFVMNALKISAMLSSAESHLAYSLKKTLQKCLGSLFFDNLHQYQDLASPSNVCYNAPYWMTFQFFTTHLYIATLGISSSNLHMHVVHIIYVLLGVRNMQSHQQVPKQNDSRMSLIVNIKY